MLNQNGTWFTATISLISFLQGVFTGLLQQVFAVVAGTGRSHAKFDRDQRTARSRFNAIVVDQQPVTPNAFVIGTLIRS